MGKKTRSELLERCKRVNLWMDYYNPGDGTKYKFFKGPNKHDYFEGGALYIAHSFKEAWAWLEGYESIANTTIKYSELLEATKGIQWLAAVKCPSYIDKEAWEDSFDRIQKAISKGR